MFNYNNGKQLKKKHEIIKLSVLLIILFICIIFTSRFQKEKILKYKIINELSNKIKQFYNNNNKLPNNLNELIPTYLLKLPKDVRGYDFIYEKINEREFFLKGYGKFDERIEVKKKFTSSSKYSTIKLIIVFLLFVFYGIPFMAILLQRYPKIKSVPLSDDILNKIYPIEEADMLKLKDFNVGPAFGILLSQGNIPILTFYDKTHSTIGTIYFFNNQKYFEFNTEIRKYNINSSNVKFTGLFPTKNEFKQIFLDSDINFVYMRHLEAVTHICSIKNISPTKFDINNIENKIISDMRKSSEITFKKIIRLPKVLLIAIFGAPNNYKFPIITQIEKGYIKL